MKKNIKKACMIVGFYFFLFCITFAAYGNEKIDSVITDCTKEVSPDSLKKYLQRLQDFGTRYAFASNERDVATGIKKDFETNGARDVVIDSFKLNNSWQHNVTATFPGFINKKKNIVTGAHSDAMSTNPQTVAPGADDDGSGCAALIEMTRIMTKKRIKNCYTWKFQTYAAEEVVAPYNHGADYAVQQAIKEKWDIPFMLNLDMIAYSINKPGNWITKYIQYTKYEYLVPQLKGVFSKFTKCKLDFRGTNNDGDSYSFVQKGIPAIWIEENWGNNNHPQNNQPYYHKPTDLVEKYDMNYFAENVKGALAYLLYMDDSLSGGITPIADIPSSAVAWNEAVTVHMKLNDFHIVVSASLHPYTVAFFTMQGRCVYEQKLTNPNNQNVLPHGSFGSYVVPFNPRSLSDNVLIMTLYTAEGMVTRKVYLPH